MSFSTSISAESSISVNSTHSKLSLRSLPTLWRRLVLFVCPNLQPDIADLGGTSPQASLEQIPEVCDQWLMSGALPNDDICQDIPQRSPCLTSSCSTRAPERITIKRKPVPQLLKPTAGRNSTNKRASIDDVRSAIEAFTRETDTSFLSPTAKQVLRHLRGLSETPPSSVRVLVQLDGKGPIWMNAKDADTLCQLRQITQRLPLDEKISLLKDLGNLIDPRAKYPLRQVMFHGVQVKPGEIQNVTKKEDRRSWFDVSAVLEEGESIKDAQEALRPTPLRIQSKESNVPHRPNVLSAITERTEPIPDSQFEGGSKLQDSTDAVSPTQPGPVEKSLPALPTCSTIHHDTTSQRSDIQSVFDLGTDPDVSDARTLGSVHDGRRLAVEAQRMAIRPTISSSRIMRSESPSAEREDSFINPRAAPRPPARPAAAVLTSIEREDSFTNPRLAPKPPAKPETAVSTTEVRRPLKAPGSVARARAAAIAALGVSSEQDSSPRTSSGTSSASDKRPGSIRKAREALVIRHSGSVREALQNLDRSQIERSEFPARPESPHLRYPRSSSLPRRHRDATTGRLGGVENTAFRPWYVSKGSNSRPELFHQNRSLEEHEEQGRKNGDAEQHPAASAKPSPARTLTIEESPYRPISTRGILSTRQTEVDHSLTGLRGGCSGNSDASFQGQDRKRRFTTFFGHVKRLEDHERPCSGLWWLAGGRVGRRSRVPTTAELRQRRSVESANREIVGFWGTILGARVVRRLPILAGDVEEPEKDVTTNVGKVKKAGGDGSANKVDGEILNENAACDEGPDKTG